MRVLGEGGRGTEFCGHFYDHLAGGCILIFEVSCVADCCKKEMVR